MSSFNAANAMTKSSGSVDAKGSPPQFCQQEQRQIKLDVLRAEGADPFPATVTRQHSNLELQEEFAGLNSGVSTDADRAAVGRVLSIRNGGIFIDVADGTAR